MKIETFLDITAKTARPGKFFFSRYLGLKIAKITKTALLNDPLTKFSKYGFLWHFPTQNPSIRKILQKNFFLSYMAQPGPGLRKFSTKTVKSSFEVI